jgi:hypothetical protein
MMSGKNKKKYNIVKKPDGTTTYTGKHATIKAILDGLGVVLQGIAAVLSTTKRR